MRGLRKALTYRIRSLLLYATVRRRGSEFDALVATVGPMFIDTWFVDDDDTYQAPEMAGVGDGWTIWRLIRSRRPGVAGIHIVLADLNAQLARFLVELGDQRDVELGRPNTGHYRFAGDMRLRNREHVRTIEAALVQVKGGMNHLMKAEKILRDRWSTWPAPAELDR